MFGPLLDVQLAKVVRDLQFKHFEFEMCLASLFEHLNFQKRSDTEVLRTF